MSERNDGGPAFPQLQVIRMDKSWLPRQGAVGMPLRDYIAVEAMTALIVKFPAQLGLENRDGTDSPETEQLNNIRKVVSKSAYLYADAMLAAREAR